MDKEEICLNCSTPLQGKYCSVCGQKHINPNLTLGQLLAEFFAELFTFDNRFFRTLKPLIFSPGKVTIDYNRGKRTYYMPLLKLYLFVSFTLFLVIAVGDVPVVQINLGDSDAKMQQQSSLTTTQQQEIPKKAIKKTTKTTKKIPRFIKDFAQWLLKKKAERGKHSNVLEQTLVNRIPHLMFFLMPFFALLLKLFYWRSDSMYTHHLVFSVHFFTFAYIIFLAIVLIGFTRVNILVQASMMLGLTPPLYLFVGLRKIYSQSRRLTFIKVVMISFFYFTAFLISMILLTVFTIAVF